MANPELQIQISAADAASPEIQRLTNALNELGIETNVIADGMAESERKAIAAFGAIADSARSTGEMVERGLVAALNRIDSPEGVQQLQQELDRLRQSGRLSAEELDRLQDAQQRLDRLTMAGSQSQAALTQELKRQQQASAEAARDAQNLGDATGRTSAQFADHRRESGALSEATEALAERFGISGEAFDALTGKLAGAAAIGALATAFVNANKEADQLARQFKAMSGDATTAQQEITYLTDVANRWGVAVNDLAPAYLRLAAATKGSTAEGQATRQMIDDLTAAYVQAGAGVAEIEEAMEILGEAFAEGTISAEDLKNAMQEDMPPALQAATAAILENSDALKTMLADGSAATEDFMPAFAAALREHIGGSATQVDTVSASFTRLTERVNALFVSIDNQTGAMTGFDAVLKGAIKTLEGGVAAVEVLTSAFAFVGNAAGAAAGALATNGNVFDAVAEQAEQAGESIGKSILSLYGLKTASEESAIRQAQMKAELEKLREETDPYTVALERMRKSLQDATKEFQNTGDAAKLTQTALENFLKTPEKNLNAKGIVDLAALLKTVGQQAEDSGQQISNTLGEELSKLSDEQLTKLEAQARKALAEASNGSETSRLAFAELGQVVEGVVLARLQKLGVDGPEALRGVDAAAQDAINDFTALAENADLSAETIEAAFQGALTKLDNPKELANFEAQLLELGESGKISGDALDKMLQQVRQRIQETASDPAFAALNKALADIREETERGIETGNQERESLQARIQSAIDLAKAKGDEAEAMHLTVLAAKEELDQAELRIQQYDRQQAEIEDHAEKLLKQAEVDGIVTQAERDQIVALADKSDALARDKAELEARLPILQREADVTARAAGPVGQLIRLYEDKADAAGRETAAVQRSYDAKVRDIDTEIAQAQAKGDTVKAQQLKIEKAELEAEAAQALADATARQMEAEIAALEAKKLDIAASELAIEAKNEEIAKIDELIAKKKEQADTAQENADTAKAEAESAKSAANATKASTAETNKNTEATNNNSNAIYNHIRGIDELSEKGKTLWADMRAGMASYGNAGQSALSVTNEVIYSIQEMISEELAAAKQAEILATTIERGGEAGQGAMRQLMMMGEGGIYAIRGITTAGEQARQKIEAIRQSALDAEQALAVMAQDFTKQILQIQGDQRALLDIEHQERLRQLDELYQKSGQYGAEEYRDAKSRAEQLHQMKLKQMADEQAADQTAERFSKTAEQAERLNRAMGVLADASLANVTRQADALHQTLSAVNNLL